jgi:hypothetical protein
MQAWAWRGVFAVMTVGAAWSLLPATAPPAVDTLAALGPQALDIEVIEYVGGPQLLDWTDAAGTTTLAGIFSQAGLTIKVNRAAPVPNVFRPELRPEELHLLLAGPVTPSGTNWMIRIFMLPVSLSEGDLGTMFDLTGRSRAAVFGQAHAGADRQRKLLHTAAHEIGHALNLVHSDGDGDPWCCAQLGGSRRGLSIMNTARCLTPAGGDFSLSQPERDHILNHPIKGVQPRSGIPWNQCPVHTHRDRC